MSNGTFMPVSGVRMSENMMTPSGLKALPRARERPTGLRVNDVRAAGCTPL
jgi:hypothetical protein